MSLWQHWRNDDPSIGTTTTIGQTNSEPNMGVTNVDDQSIAVLPFVNIAQSVDNEPFNEIPGAIALNTAYEEKLVEQQASLMAML